MIDFDKYNNLEELYNDIFGKIFERLSVNDTVVDCTNFVHDTEHISQFLLEGETKIIDSINRLKSFDIASRYHEKSFLNFVKMIYHSSDEEIYSKITETYILIKDLMKQYKLNSFGTRYENIIKTTQAWKISQQLIDYDITKDFENIDIKKQSNFFYLFTKNSEFFKSIEHKNNFVKDFLIFVKVFKDMSFRQPTYDYNLDLEKIYNFYQKFINSQGRKMQTKIMKMFDLFEN